MEAAKGGTTSTQYGSDGTYTQTEILITTETAGGRLASLKMSTGNVGKLTQMSAVPSENTWKTTASKNAGVIHAKFMVLEDARKALMNTSYTG